jgi:hypothetical protein
MHNDLTNQVSDGGGQGLAILQNSGTRGHSLHCLVKFRFHLLLSTRPPHVGASGAG